MSPDLYYIVRALLDEAKKYCDAEELFFQPNPVYPPYPYFDRVCNIERGMAVAAYRINRLNEEYRGRLSGLSEPPFTIALRREMDALPELIAARLRRWGWDYILSPNGSDRIRERIEADEKTKFYPLLDAARSWREGKNIAPHSGADRLTDVAIRLRIKPTMTPDEGE